jgi:hypothetical protein
MYAGIEERMISWVMRSDAMEQHDGPWIARDDEDFERRIAQEKASAHDLCLALRWHRANIAETLPVVDEDGDAERMAEVRQILDALGHTRGALATYFHLPLADATEDDDYARGEPPRLHVADEARDTLGEPIRQSAPDQARQRWAMQLKALFDSYETVHPPRRKQSRFVDWLFGR